MKNLQHLMVLAILLGWSASASAADIVYRKSTTTALQGEITESSSTEITVKKRVGKPETVPVNDIVDIRWDGEPAKLNLARSAEKAGNVEKALSDYLEITKDPKSKGNIKTDLTFLIARATAKLAMGDPLRLDDAIKLLDGYRKANKGSFRDFEAASLLGQAYLAKKDYPNAKTAFDQLAKAPWNDYKMAAQTANARILLLGGNVDGALSAFDAVIAAKATKPAEITRQQEAMLGKVKCLQLQKKHDEAVIVVEQIIEKVAAEDSAVQAEAYVLQGDSLQAQGKTKEAVLAYLHVDVLFTGEKALHPEALYHLAKLWGTVGEADRAADARDTLQSEYPNSAWAKKLAGG